MAEQRLQASRYSGELAIPVALPSGRGRAAGVASTESETREALASRLGDEAWLAAERNRKFLHLIDHYGIDCADPDLWPKLALALAEEHVPGFQARQRPGRRRGSVKVPVTLEPEIDALVAQGLSVRKAAEQVNKRYAEAARRLGKGYDHDAATLEKLYHQRRAQKAQAEREAQVEREASLRIRREAGRAVRGVSPDEAERLFRIGQAWLDHIKAYEAEPAEAERMRVVVEAVHEVLGVPLDEPERVVSLILGGALRTAAVNK